MNKYKVEKELAEVINRNSLEYESGTPDFILARYLMNCLQAWNKCYKDKVNYEQGLTPVKGDYDQGLRPIKGGD